MKLQHLTAEEAINILQTIADKIKAADSSRDSDDIICWIAEKLDINFDSE